MASFRGTRFITQIGIFHYGLGEQVRTPQVSMVNEVKIKSSFGKTLTQVLCAFGVIFTGVVVKEVFKARQLAADLAQVDAHIEEQAQSIIGEVVNGIKVVGFDSQLGGKRQIWTYESPFSYQELEQSSAQRKKEMIAALRAGKGCLPVKSSFYPTPERFQIFNYRTRDNKLFTIEISDIECAGLSPLKLKFQK